MALKERQFSNDDVLNSRILSAVRAVEAGDTADLDEMIKKEPTCLFLASPNHPQWRFRPGSTLITYVGVGDDGKAIQETGDYASAQIKEGSVITANIAPLVFPEGHFAAGWPMKGFFSADGSFTEDFRGPEVLMNEYVQDVPGAQVRYGVTPVETPQTAYKKVKTFALAVGDVAPGTWVSTNKGVEIAVDTPGARALVDWDTAKDKIIGVQGIALNQYEGTYGPYAEFAR